MDDSYMIDMNHVVYNGVHYKAVEIYVGGCDDCDMRKDGGDGCSTIKGVTKALCSGSNRGSSYDVKWKE